MKYYSTEGLSEILNVPSQTIRNWNESGKLIPHHMDSKGYRYYSHEQLDQILSNGDFYDKNIRTDSK